jgi:hypothetical protein
MTNYEDAGELVFSYIQYNVIETIAEINLRVQTLTLAGADPMAIRQLLIDDLQNNGRIFGGLANGVTGATNLGITSSAQVAELLTYVEEGYQNLKWVTVSKKPCPQCAERAGRIESKEYWEAIGYPRSGFSVCGPNCKCHLVPDKYVGKDTIILD